MSFNYGMRGKTPQQQAIVRQRENAEKIRREESEKQKIEDERRNIEYEFEYESVKSELNEKELSHFMVYLQKHKDIIIREVLRNKKLKIRDLETPLEIDEVDLGNNHLQAVYKSFQFTIGNDNIIKVTKIT